MKLSNSKSGDGNDNADHSYDDVQWIEMLERLGAPLHNPGNILKWNSSKTYLVELQDKGKGMSRIRSWATA